MISIDRLYQLKTKNLCESLNHYMYLRMFILLRLLIQTYIFLFYQLFSKEASLTKSTQGMLPVFWITFVHSMNTVKGCFATILELSREDTQKTMERVWWKTSRKLFILSLSATYVVTIVKNGSNTKNKKGCFPVYLFLMNYLSGV